MQKFKINKMKKILSLIVFTNFHICYCQTVPPPPPPINKSQKNYKKTDIDTKIIEVSDSKENSENEVCNVEVYKIDSKYFIDKNSKYYYKTVEKKLNDVDLNISDEEIIAYTKYRNSSQFDPFKIDDIAYSIYKLNENSKFEEVIKLCDQLKSVSPNNITLFKELSFAYKKLGKTEISNKYFEMMKKIISAVEKYSDGCRINPYILNNSFEGKSLYEAKFSLFPSKTRFILTKTKKMIYGYDIYQIMRFADLDHYKKYLKKGDYKIE